MNIERVYRKFTDRVNILSSGNGQSVGGVRQFVDTFNEAQYSILREALAADEATDLHQEVMAYYFSEAEPNGIESQRYTEYVLPEDFEHLKSLWVTAKGSCDVQLHAHQRRLTEAPSLYRDSLYEPNLAFEQTFFTVGNGKVRVYRKGFSTNVVIYYYKKPRLVDMAGYQSLGSGSQNIDPEIEGRHLEEVLDRAARIHLRNVGDQRVNMY